MTRQLFHQKEELGASLVPMPHRDEGRASFALPSGRYPLRHRAFAGTAHIHVRTLRPPWRRQPGRRKHDRAVLSKRPHKRVARNNQAAGWGT